MAEPRESTILIKCAGCGEGIDIMTLADHVCEANAVSVPAAPVAKLNLFGSPTAPTTDTSPVAVAAEKPSIGGFFGWRKAAAPPKIDTNEANNRFVSTPELSGSDYSDDENRSASPVTPSTQITSPGSTWSRGMSKGSRMSDTQSQQSPTIEKPLPDESIAETTTRLGGLFGTGGLFKRLNNVSAGPFVSTGTDDTTASISPEKIIDTPSEASSDTRPKFRNAAGRDQLKMSNKLPSPMAEVYGSKAAFGTSNDLFADIQDSNPFASKGRSKTDVARPSRASPPQTPQKEEGFKSSSTRAPAMPSRTKFDYSLPPEPISSTPAPARRKFSEASAFWNSSSSATGQTEARFQGRLRAPSFKTEASSLRSERPTGLAAKPSFGMASSEPRLARPKMFPEATPPGASPAPRSRPPPVNRFARNEFDMYANSMSSTPTSVNSSPERLPFGHGRKPSNSSSVPSSNASVSSGGSARHSCRVCARPIMGRSLRDSSGRLSGRYHHDCFCCAVCAAPFPTGDFYVLDNQPLCKRDYHERNGTQCSRCRGGIEGRYVETDKRQMFHDGCFCCAECDINLGEEYWEVGGRPMCQPHAMAASQVESRMRPAAGPGRMNTYRSPQRRQTRFGMMGAGGGSFKRR